VTDPERPHAPRASDVSLADLTPEVYAELKRIASLVARRIPHATLGTTALLHEAWLKLKSASGLSITSREHFVALVVRTVRQVAVDSARRRLTLKRNAALRVDVSMDDMPGSDTAAEVTIAADQAIDALQAHDPRAARILEMRYFARMTIAETAAELGLSSATVERAQAYGEAWLHRWMAGVKGNARG